MSVHMMLLCYDLLEFHDSYQVYIYINNTILNLKYMMYVSDTAINV